MGQNLKFRVYEAQKEYTCVSCGKPVEKGQKYVRIIDVQRDNVRAVKIHHPENPCPTPKEKRYRANRQDWIAGQ